MEEIRSETESPESSLGWKGTIEGFVGDEKVERELFRLRSQEDHKDIVW